MTRTDLAPLDRWERNLANGSTVYATVSARRLRAFCREREVSAEEIAAMELKPLRELIEDYLADERKKGHAGEYIRTTIKAIRSWRSYNEKDSPHGLRVPNLRVHPKVDAEKTPTTDDLRRVLLAATAEERVPVALMAFMGGRLQWLGNHAGNDGLTVGDFPEMRVERGRVAFETVPTIVRIRPALSKAGHGFFAFLGPEGCRYVAESLVGRMRKGEKIGPETDIVSPIRARKRFMTTINIGDRIRRPMRACGVMARPYSWRSYFIQKALEAQSATGGAVPDRFIEAWVGHVGDVSQRHYGAGKPNLPSSLVAEMRNAYAKLLPFLETSLNEKPRPDPAIELKRSLARLVGLSEKEAARYAVASNDEFLRAVRPKLLGASALEPIPAATREGTSGTAPASRAGEERAVETEDVSNYLASGWVFKSPLNAHLAVVAWPGEATDRRLSP